jgi:hypothetical protein
MNKPAAFCNYEHLGECSEWLTHRAPYWVGEAKKRFGPWAYWCSNHAKNAAHIAGIRAIDHPIVRNARKAS